MLHYFSTAVIDENWLIFDFSDMNYQENLWKFERLKRKSVEKFLERAIGLNHPEWI